MISLIPLPYVLRNSVKAKMGSIGLLFSIFSLCACMLEVQGDRQVERTMMTTKLSLLKLRAQLQRVLKRKHTSIQTHIFHNIRVSEEYLGFLCRFVDKSKSNVPLNSRVTGSNVHYAMLNPWMAGQHIAVSAFLISLTSTV